VVSSVETKRRPLIPIGSPAVVVNQRVGGCGRWCNGKKPRAGGTAPAPGDLPRADPGGLRVAIGAAFLPVAATPLGKGARGRVHAVFALSLPPFSSLPAHPTLVPTINNRTSCTARF
jgi:hypothetical protein